MSGRQIGGEVTLVGPRLVGKGPRERLLGNLKTVIGFSIGSIGRQDPELIGQRRAELWKMLAAGQLRPAHKAFPMERIADAVELIETRRNLGRVLIHTT
ncbi:zinc-binding dehydrogenase [Streptosporangium sp. NBC_01639]|uniref:zinc-binding dehydrogenase n=1 Tax=Streptosporangium sp. NBC_01639 TaxID=2975948 RepID=UPI0038655E3D